MRFLLATTTQRYRSQLQQQQKQQQQSPLHYYSKVRVGARPTYCLSKWLRQTVKNVRNKYKEKNQVKERKWRHSALMLMIAQVSSAAAAAAPFHQPELFFLSFFLLVGRKFVIYLLCTPLDLLSLSLAPFFPFSFNTSNLHNDDGPCSMEVYTSPH